MINKMKRMNFFTVAAAMFVLAASCGQGQPKQQQPKAVENNVQQSEDPPIVADDLAIEWKRNFGGGDGYFKSVIEVADGIVAVGEAEEESFGKGDWTGVAGKGSVDAILVKYDYAGNIVWRKNFGGGGNDRFFSVCAGSNGFAAVGKALPFGGDWGDMRGQGDNDAMIAEFDNAGNKAWLNCFGGEYNDQFEGVTAVSDGVIAVGETDIVKFNKKGNTEWIKSFEGQFFGVTTVSDGVVVVGYSNESSFGKGDWEGVVKKGGHDAILVKYNNSGDIVWKKSFGGAGLDWFTSVCAVSDGLVAVGMMEGQSFGNGDWTGIKGDDKSYAMIVKFDNKGKVIWKKIFNNNQYSVFTDITAVSGGFLAVGYSAEEDFDSPDATPCDAIIVKYDSAGNQVWEKTLSGKGDDRYYSVTALRNGGIVAVGESTKNSFGTGDWSGVKAKGDERDAIIVYYK
jgi:hypothetical protein